MSGEYHCANYCALRSFSVYKYAVLVYITRQVLVKEIRRKEHYQRMFSPCEMFVRVWIR